MKVGKIAWPFVALLVSASAFASPATPTSSALFNPGFEDFAAEGTFPHGWSGGGEGYLIESDSNFRFEGRWSGHIASYPRHGKFGTLTQCIQPDEFLGSHASYTGFLKTMSVANGWAGLWLRVDGPNGEILAFDNMQGHGLRGSVNWVRKGIELPVAWNAVRICFGALLVGDGHFWVDALDLRPVSAR